MSVYLKDDMVLLDSDLVAVDAGCCCGGGACCRSGFCDIETADDCGVDGGVYQGDDTTCDPNPCCTSCFMSGFQAFTGASRWFRTQTETHSLSGQCHENTVGQSYSIISVAFTDDIECSGGECSCSGSASCHTEPPDCDCSVDCTGCGDFFPLICDPEDCNCGPFSGSCGDFCSPDVITDTQIISSCTAGDCDETNCGPDEDLPCTGCGFTTTVTLSDELFPCP